ncbi:MAG: ATP-dependent Clp protease proteolytic subunit [Nitrososphaerota archaeon]
MLNNFWILLFVFLFLAPQWQKMRLNIARKEILKKIRDKRKSTVITLIHRQETIAFLGIPLSRYIDIDDSEEVLRAIREAPPETPIDLIIHTPGGIALAATQIALALRAHRGKTTVIVPHYAMSGGTLIALAADQICLDEHAVLGPVDPQLEDRGGYYPAASVLRILEKKHIDRISDRTLIIAEESKKAMNQTESLVRKLLQGRYTEEQVNKIIDEFVSGKYTHDYPITGKDIAKLLGTCVDCNIPKEVYELMRLYKMETRTSRPGVEYVPIVPKKQLEPI